MQGRSIAWILLRPALMEGSFSSSLQIYVEQEDDHLDRSGDSLSPSHPSWQWPNPHELAAKETWRSKQSKPIETHLQPFTLPWFLALERRRYARHGRWIPRLLEVHKHKGERLLALGDGLGMDWIRYAEYGSDVVVVSPEREQIEIVRHHFHLRGLTADFVHTPVTSFPIADGTVDVVCLSERDWQSGEIEPTLKEIYRVLKPGGKLLAVLPAWYNAQQWENLVLPWRWYKRTPTDTSKRFTAREVYRLLAGFEIHRTRKRHLRRSDLPHLWRWMILPIMERLMGRFLIVKAFKPISAAMSFAKAA